MTIPSVRGNPTIPNPATITNPTTVNGTTATTTVTGVNTTTPPATTPVGNPNLSGAPAVVNRDIKGLPAGFDVKSAGFAMSGNASNAGDGMTGGYVARPTTSYFVAYGDVTAVKPTQDGFSVDVQLYAKKATDEVALFLQLPVVDKKSGKLTMVNLDLLTHDAAKGTFGDNVTTAAGKDPVSNAACFTGTRSYAFSLKQINDFIKSNGLDLQVKPGDQLSISGLIKNDGHRIMNAQSNAFSVPKPTVTNAQTVMAGRIGNMTNQAIKAQDLPLDISLKLPKSLLETSSYMTGGIKPGDILEGEITTRLESEYKGSVDAGQMHKMISKGYELSELSEKALGGDAAARKKLDRLLGPDLVLTPVKRHWMASDGAPLGSREVNDKNVVGATDANGKFVPALDSAGKEIVINRDNAGWPNLDPMKDAYSDDKNLSFSRESGAARVRGNAQKMGHAEFKIGGGVLDPKTGIRQRVETGLSLKPGATEDQLKKLLKAMNDYPTSPIATSPLGHVLEEAKKGGVLNALIDDRTPWADVTQIRHKFELKNTKTGTAAELSLDMVTSTTMRKEHEVNGQPQVREYYVIETELDHLQLNSSNVTEMADTKTKAALTSATDQETWLKDTAAAQKKGDVELEVMSKPQLHSNDHVKEGSFRHTSSYKDFESMQEKLLVAICDGGAFKPGPARQKSAHFAELLGLIPPENTVTT
jgi:hypothetical protein